MPATLTVPPGKFGKALRVFLREAGEELLAQQRDVALGFAYKEAVDLSPVDLGGARFGLMPSAKEPKIQGHQTGRTFGKPGEDRLAGLLEEFRRDPDAHGFLTFHALDKQGVYDYAGNDTGRSLENGWSQQAPDGVLGPTQKRLRSKGLRLMGTAARRAAKELRR